MKAKDKRIFVTKASLPNFNEYADLIKVLWNTHLITNNGFYV